MEFNTRVFSESWIAWNSLGAAYFRLDRKQEALKAYEKALELNPDNESAKQMMERIRAKKRV